MVWRHAAPHMVSSRIWCPATGGRRGAIRGRGRLSGCPPWGYTVRRAGIRIAIRPKPERAVILRRVSCRLLPERGWPGDKIRRSRRLACPAPSRSTPMRRQPVTTRGGFAAATFYETDGRAHLANRNVKARRPIGAPARRKAGPGARGEPDLLPPFTVQFAARPNACPCRTCSVQDVDAPH